MFNSGNWFLQSTIIELFQFKRNGSYLQDISNYYTNLLYESFYSLLSIFTISSIFSYCQNPSFSQRNIYSRNGSFLSHINSIQYNSTQNTSNLLRFSFFLVHEVYDFTWCQLKHQTPVSSFRDQGSIHRIFENLLWAFSRSELSPDLNFTNHFRTVLSLGVFSYLYLYLFITKFACIFL